MNNQELSEGGNDFDQDWADIDPQNLPPIDDVIVEESDTDEDINVVIEEEDNGGNVSPVDGAKENDALLGIDDAAAPIDAQQSFEALAIPTSSAGNTNLGRAPTKLRLQMSQTTKVPGFGIENESMFSAEYLEQSEKFVQATINICEAQDIIPRVFNIKVHVAVGLSILCTTFAVLPTAARLAFGSDCAAWSD